MAKLTQDQRKTIMKAIIAYDESRLGIYAREPVKRGALELVFRDYALLDDAIDQLKRLISESNQK